MVERMGPVDFWGVAVPKRLYWEYWDEKGQFRYTFKCDNGTYVIMEIVAKNICEGWKQ